MVHILKSLLQQKLSASETLKQLEIQNLYDQQTYAR